MQSSQNPVISKERWLEDRASKEATEEVSEVASEEVLVETVVDVSYLNLNFIVRGRGAPRGSFGGGGFRGRGGY